MGSRLHTQGSGNSTITTGSVSGKVVVSTVAALKALDTANATNYPTGTSVEVLGYYTAGDDAGVRTYRLNRTDTTTPDNGGTSLTALNSGRWHMMADYANLNVCWFGAVGDFNGTTGTDNLAAFEACRNAIMADAKGGTMHVPVGAYYFASIWDVRDNFRVKVQGYGVMASTESKGSSRGSTLVFADTLADGIRIGHTLAAGGANTDVKHTGPHFENINFVAAGTGRTMTLVNLKLTTGFRFRNCTFRDGLVGLTINSDETTHGGATVGGDAAWGEVRGCHFYNNHKHIYVPFSGGATIENCKFMQSSSVPFTNGWAIHIVSGVQYRIMNNKFDTTVTTLASKQGGIFVEGQFVQIGFNQFEDMGVGVRVGASAAHADAGYGNTIVGNRFRNPTGTVAVDILDVAGKVRATTVMGNQYKGGGTDYQNAATGTPATFRVEATGRSF